MVRLSEIPLDPNLPKPVVKKPSPKVKVSQPPPRKRVGRVVIKMKRRDWLCPKCDFIQLCKKSQLPTMWFEASKKRAESKAMGMPRVQLFELSKKYDML